LASSTRKRGLAPVHQPQLDGCRVVTPGGEVVLVERLIGQRAGEFGIIDRKAELLSDLAARQPGAGPAGDVAEHDILVVIGKTLRHGIVARDQPAPAQRRDAGRELGLEIGGNCAHDLALSRFAIIKLTRLSLYAILRL
jgi:hypothetical protein